MSIYDEILGPDPARLIGVVVNSSYAQIIAAEAGMGIVPVPTYAYALGARLEPLDAAQTISLPIWLAYHSDLHDDPDIKLTINWLQTLFEPKDYPWFRRNVIAPHEFRTLMGPQRYDLLVGKISTRKASASIEG